MRRDRERSRRPGTSKRTSVLNRGLDGLKWIGSVPGRAFPRREVVESGRMIWELLAAIRGVARSDRRVPMYEDRGFDLEATAFLHEMNARQLDAVLRHRRRQTALAAYIFFGAAWLVFIFWCFKIATMPWASSHIIPVLEFAPFSLLLFLMAFRSALQNYQIRFRRLATAWEYLNTSERFWPD